MEKKLPVTTIKLLYITQDFVQKWKDYLTLSNNISVRLKQRKKHVILKRYCTEDPFSLILTISHHLECK